MYLHIIDDPSGDVLVKRKLSEAEPLDCDHHAKAYGDMIGYAVEITDQIVPLGCAHITVTIGESEDPDAAVCWSTKSYFHASGEALDMEESENEELPVAGTVREYRDLHDGDQRVTTTLLASKECERGTWRLERRSAGWACAGSAARWDNACYAVTINLDGSDHGRRFKAYEEARAHYDSRK